MEKTHQPPRINRFLAALPLATVLAMTQPAEAASYTWNVASGNWSTPASWNPTTTGPNGPLAADSVIFGANDTSGSSTTVNNIVDAAFAGTITGLTYNSSSSSAFNVTQIASGQTLTVTGPVLVGGLNGVGLVTEAYMTGGGALVVTGSPFTLQNYGSASGANSTAYLDLSGLSSFVYSNSAGTMSIEDNPGSLTRLGGNLTLAAVSNLITVSNLNLGTSTSAQAGPAGTLVLGPGTNVLNVANLNLVNNKSSFTVSVAATTGGLRLRGLSGADTARATITIGNRNQTGTGTSTGTLSLNGSPVDIKAGTLTVGANPSGSTTGTDTGTGVVQFDTGTVDATTIVLANAGAANGTANGTITVGANGTLLVGFGGISLATQTAGTAAGTLTIAAGGTVNCLGNIIQGTTAGTGTLSLGGALIMGLDTSIGTTTVPINSFTLANNATWQFTPSGSGQPSAVVGTLTWPANDSTLTLNIAGLPVGAAIGSNYTLVQFTSFAGGALTAPILNLPSGVTGTLSQTANAIVLTLTGGVVPAPPPAPSDVVGSLEGNNQLVLTWTDTGATSYDILRSTNATGPFAIIAEGVTGTTYTDTAVASAVTFYYYEVIGVNANGPSTSSSPAPVAYGQGNQLVNPGFETGDFTGWTTGGANVVVAGTSGTYGQLNQNPAAINSGAHSLFIDDAFWYDYMADYAYQDVTATAGDLFVANAWCFTYANDCIFEQIGVAGDATYNGPGTAYLEVQFRDVTKTTILADYISAQSDWSTNTWVFLAVTNQVTPGTTTIIGTVPSGQLVAPAGTGDVRYQVNAFMNNWAVGSVFNDDNELVFVSGPVPPVVTSAMPNGLTLCTNTVATATATAVGASTIASFQVVTKTSPLGSTVTTTLTNLFTTNNPPLVSGLGTATATINYPLSTNLNYKVTITATDSTDTSAGTSATFDTIAPTLVIEATDFDFTTNGVSGVYIDTPPNGGIFLYTNQVSTEGIDEHKNPANTSTKAAYRSGDEAVIQPAGSTTFNEQKFASAGVVELCVDYTSSFDWLNYTRTYGPGGSAPAGTYDVYLCMGTALSGIQSSLYQIAGDPTSSDQATNFLGYFGTASFTENNWAGYEYVPLTDQYGNLVSTTIPAGPQTLRIYQIANPNLEYLLLMPVAPVLTPVLKYFYPDGVHPFEPTNVLTYTIGPANGSNILSSGIDLVVNGVDVTSTAGFSLTPSGDSWIANYSIKSNAVYSAILNVTNTAGLSSSFTNNFDTFNVNYYQWEAVDYDYTANGVSGLFIDNPVPTCDVNVPQTGHLATNSYYAYPADLPGVSVALQGTDINFPDTQPTTSDYYRADGVGSQPATDYLRPKFVAEQTYYGDNNIGPFNIGYFNGGNWLNYTRTYPTNTYNVWGRLAGGSGSFSGTTLSLVTNGYGTPDQATSVLGTFSDPSAAGWQAYHWIPLLDSNANKVVVSLGGVATLRLTSGGNLNAEFFMLVPAPPAFAVTPTVAGGQITLSFLAASGHTYTVLFTSSLTPANWAPVGNVITGNGAVTNVPETLTGAQGYYTVGVQ